MLQALIKSGRIQALEVPGPTVSPGSILIKTVYSCISAGTEGAGVESSKPKSLLQTALVQPEKVEKAIQSFKEKGLLDTIHKVRQVRRDDRKSFLYPRPTGYSLAGMVAAMGAGVTGFKIGDRVAASGNGIASHAQYVDVPVNLVTRMPAGLDYRSASTVTLGGIAMQAVRRAGIQLGEFVVVYGTGILGLLSLQMARAAGGRCLAVDLDQARLEIAAKYGAELTVRSSVDEAAREVFHHTGGHGADVVLFTAATKNPNALSLALKMTRKKGRLVMVGVYGDRVNRHDLYRKEIDFLISTSYGPGRYEPNYEERGLDYPYAYVRWTEQRNLQEYLRLLSCGAVSIEPMIGKTFPIEQVDHAFKELENPNRPLLLFLHYGNPTEEQKSAQYKPGRIELNCKAEQLKSDRIRVGLIGAGNFAANVHLPNLAKLSSLYKIRAICSKTGSKTRALAERFGADYATTDYHEILNDPGIDLTMICTRHNLHGRMVLESLQAGKHTFVEKPLCTTMEELEAIKGFHGLADSQSENMNADPRTVPDTRPILMVGFNRRYSKYAQEIKRHTDKRINPLIMHYRMNAGYSPPDHWVHTEEGGGRIIGEACHIIDLFSYIVGAPVRACSCAAMSPKTESVSGSDNKIIALEYEDGSIGSIHYFAVGSKELEKEYMEVHFDGKSIFLYNYTALKGLGVGVHAVKSPEPEKGQLAELIAAHAVLKEGDRRPIDLGSLIETTQITIALS